jgi:hypothetical protein
MEKQKYAVFKYINFTDTKQTKFPNENSHNPSADSPDMHPKISKSY